MKILVVQNRMGIGDMVIFLPFIEAISKKYNSPVSILVKANSKASEFLDNNKYINNIIILDRDNKSGSHDGLLGSIKLIKDLKKFNFEKVFIFNSSLRFNLISKFSGIKEIYQYPLFTKKNQHIIKTAQDFIKSQLGINVESKPFIQLEDKLIDSAKKNFKIDNNEINILLGIGGSGSTKRVPAKKYIEFMEMAIKNYNCKFFLATGKNEEEQAILKQILQSIQKDKCIPLDQIRLKDTLPIIKNCQIAICNDSSFSHLSAALGIKTITLMVDTPIIYGNYNSKMFPVIPDGEETVSHHTSGKDRINPQKIFDKALEILN